MSIGLVLAAGASRAAVAPAPPAPEDGDSFNAWVADQQTYDDNLYRVPSTSSVATELSPNATRGDSYNTGSLGFQGQLVAARQTFQLQARGDYNAFVHNTNLDNTSYDLNTVWDWTLFSPLTGQVGAELSRYLVNFSEVRFDAKDMVDSDNYFLKGRYQLGPHWSVLGSVAKATSEHSAEVLNFNNFRAVTYAGQVEYATEVDDTFMFKYTYYKGRYPDNIAFGCTGATPVGSNVPCAPLYLDSDYVEHFPQFFVKYGITDKTVFSGNIGRLKRQYETSVNGSFTGVIWRVRFDWQATEKVSLAARSWHEVHAYDVSAADYFISTGGSVAPNWVVTSKIDISGIFSYERQHYIANSFSEDVYGIYGTRDDKIVAQQLNVQYTPRDRWILNVFFRHEHRNSSLATAPGIYPFTYGDDVVNASFTYKFF